MAFTVCKPPRLPWVVAALFVLTLPVSRVFGQDDPCKDRWGKNCERLCHCHRPCDLTTGFCPENACHEGWSGPSCQRENVALRKPTEGTQPYNGDWTSNKAVDGDERNWNIYDNACYHSEDYTKILGFINYSPQLSAVLTVDLGRFYSVVGMRLVYRQGYFERFQGGRVYITADKDTSSRQTPCWTYADAVPKTADVHEFECRGRGRFVTMENPPRPGNNDPVLLEVCELQVFSCAPGMWGHDCSKLCSCGDMDCDPYTGNCLGLCPPGFLGADCKMKCTPGSFGQYCSEDCHCLLGSCNHVTGACPSNLCAPGWTGETCGELCPQGQFGQDCTSTCSQFCRTQRCDSATGDCSDGCQPGYAGHNCTETCPKGSYGDRCQETCHCASGMCDHVTGFCAGACLPGYQGDFCQDVCPQGTFGQNCSSVCHCKGAHCDAIKGLCKEGCVAGWTGDSCSEACSPGSFGQDCLYSCHCDGAPCLPDNGTCSGDCLPGWKGDNCSFPCDDGWWGPGCVQRCGNCSVPCLKNSGFCSLECSQGWQGPRCDMVVVPDALTTTHYIAIGVAAGVAILAVVVGVVCCRKRLNGALKLNNNLQTENIPQETI